MLAKNIVPIAEKKLPLPDLKEFLNYPSPLVIKRFKRNMPHLVGEAEAPFEDMLKYLWLCRHREIALKTTPADPDLQFSCVMHKEMRDIDEMWHTFILITIDYHDFCNHYFGSYMHHVPEVGD